MRRRKFLNGECNHVYQRTVEGFNIFYDQEDFLVCYMILSVTARKRNVKILSMCFMVDHIHILIETQTCKEMVDFIRDYSSVYVHEYNRSTGREGKLFYKSFGSAPKKGDKKTRSAIIYIGNNPVEKKLCISPETYRWNFLAYMDNMTPFSRKPKISRPLKRALDCLKDAVSADRYINYYLLRRIIAPLSADEREYFVDSLISAYLPIDKKRLYDYFDGFMQMMQAMKATTGSDYDIKEKFYPESDGIYYEMAKIVREEAGISPVRKVTVMTTDQKLKIASHIKSRIPAVTNRQLCKFLQIKLRKHSND